MLGVLSFDFQSHNLPMVSLSENNPWILTSTPVQVLWRGPGFCLGFLQLINLTRRGEEEIFSMCHTNTAASSQVNQLFHVHDHRASAIILPAHNPAMCCRRTFSMNDVTTTEAKPLFYFLALWNRNTHFKCWITIKSVRSSREKSRF